MGDFRSPRPTGDFGSSLKFVSCHTVALDDSVSERRECVGSQATSSERTISDARKRCRAKAQSFHNAKPRNQMLQLAAEYERKAARVEHAEARLRRTGCCGDDVPLAPK
jgi:hypothetical protein